MQVRKACTAKGTTHVLRARCACSPRAILLIRNFAGSDFLGTQKLHAPSAPHFLTLPFSRRLHLFAQVPTTIKLDDELTIHSQAARLFGTRGLPNPTPPHTHSPNALRASQVVFLPSIVIVPMLGSCSHRVADDGALLPPLQGLWPVGAPAGLRGAFRAHPRPIWPLCDASTVGLGAAGWLLRLRLTVRGGLGEFGAVQLARSRAAGPA